MIVFHRNNFEQIQTTSDLMIKQHPSLTYKFQQEYQKDYAEIKMLGKLLAKRFNKQEETLSNSN